jgi:hypothetical protein
LNSFFIKNLIMALCASLVVHVGQISDPIILESLPFGLFGVFFWGIDLFTKGSSASNKVYISRDVVFDETVFPFSEMHPNAGARLRQEILLLPQHLLNAGDALHDPDVTNHRPGASSRSVLQDTEKNLGQNSDQMVQNTCDGGVFLQDPPGAQLEADSAVAGGSRSHDDPAAGTDTPQPAPRGVTRSAAAPTGSSEAPSSSQPPATSPASPRGGDSTGVEADPAATNDGSNDDGTAVVVDPLRRADSLRPLRLHLHCHLHLHRLLQLIH